MSSTSQRRRGGFPPAPTPQQLDALKKAMEPGHRAQGAMYRRSPAERLRWVLRFAAEQLRPDEAEGQAHALAMLMPESDGWQTDMDALAPLSARQLRGLRREIREGLERLLGGETWELPVPQRARLNRASLLPSGYQLRWQAPLRASILLGIADLIRRHGARLRACRRCRAPFLAVKRQEFCGPACGQLTRDEKKRKVRAGIRRT